MGSHFLPQGIFPMQGSNPGVQQLQADALPFELSGNPEVVKTFKIFLPW